MLKETIPSLHPKNKSVDSSNSDTTSLKQKLLKNILSTFRQSNKGQKRICSENLNIAHGTIYAGLNAKPPKFSAFHLLPLMLGTGDFRILSFLCQESGYQNIKLPDTILETNIRQAEADFLLVLGEFQKTLGLALYRKNRATDEDLACQLNFIIAGAVRLRELLKNEERDEKK